MDKTIFRIDKMDCPSEERLVRMKLDGNPDIENMEFNLSQRQLTVYHNGHIHAIEKALNSLNLGMKKLATEQIAPSDIEEAANQRIVLWAVLVINFVFFIIEISTGLISKSMGLVADSLDMLADSFVYGLSLFAVGGTLVRKKNIARLAGYFQILLAVLGFMEVIRRFIGSAHLPDFTTMIIVSIFALLANGICLYMLQKSNSKEEAHMKASMIFTSNDVIINLGVIAAAILVKVLQSNKPDLVIGSIVFILVMRGAFRILKLGRKD
ncbi:cation transporter [Saccharicrinis sp. FJH54]|uniref:cation transporter n=1 Tax=Saccharicrinis sp. FJH54 TaxID=3344665 RepID=UPI0035D3DFD9